MGRRAIRGVPPTSLTAWPFSYHSIHFSLPPGSTLLFSILVWAILSTGRPTKLNHHQVARSIIALPLALRK